MLKKLITTSLLLIGLVLVARALYFNSEFYKVGLCTGPAGTWTAEIEEYCVNR